MKVVGRKTSINPRDEARRRWGRVRIVEGGLSRRSGKRRIKQHRLPGTRQERRLIERLMGRALPVEQMGEAIKLLRMGARLKELEINSRLERILHPADEQ